MEKYNKFFYALGTAVVAFLGGLFLAVQDGHISAAEWISAAMVFLGPIVVLFAPANQSVAQPVTVVDNTPNKDVISTPMATDYIPPSASAHTTVADDTAPPFPTV